MAFPTKKELKGLKAGATGGGFSKIRMVSSNDQIPKKSRKEAKYCALCKNHGGAQNTHNTGDCKKYNLNGTPKESFAEKNTQRNMHNEHASHKPNASYMQLSAKITKLEKSNKKLKRARKKRKREYVRVSDGSNSS